MAVESTIMSVLSILAYVVAGAFVLGLLFGGYLLVRRELQYKYSVFVIDLTATGGFRFLSDRGGVFVDRKTKNKLFFLKYEKSSLSPDHIPFVLYNKTKTVFVLKRGTKSFSYTSPNIIEKFVVKKVPVLDKSGKPTFDASGEQVFEEKRIKDDILNFNVGDEDVNWALNTFDRNKTLFSQTTLMQLLPFITLAFIGVIIAVIFIYFFKEMHVLAEMAASFKEAAVELAKGQAGTVVTVGGV